MYEKRRCSDDMLVSRSFGCGVEFYQYVMLRAIIVKTLRDDQGRSCKQGSHQRFIDRARFSDRGNIEGEPFHHERCHFESTSIHKKRVVPHKKIFASDFVV